MVRAHAGILRGPLEKLFEEYRLNLPYRETSLKAELQRIFIMLFRSPSLHREGRPVFAEAQQRLLLQYMEDRVAEHPAPADLARHLRMSRDYFARVFRWTFGASPQAYSAGVRLSCELRASSQVMVLPV